MTVLVNTRIRYIFPLLLLAGFVINLNAGSISEQVPPSATPVRVSLPTPTIVPTDGATPTPTQTPTETSEAGAAGVLLQALETAGDVNVRIEGDINADRVGSISFGETYRVTGRYFLWYQIVFEASPTGRAFVFSDLVEIVAGDVTTLPDLSIATAGPPVEVVATDEAATGEPAIGIDATDTADARVINPPSGEGAIIAPDGEGTIIFGALPTFTYPADAASPRATAVSDATVTQGETADSGQQTGSQTGLAPIAPILVLAGLGLLGLLVSAIGR